MTTSCACSTNSTRKMKGHSSDCHLLVYLGIPAQECTHKTNLEVNSTHLFHNGSICGSHNAVLDGSHTNDARSPGVLLFGIKGIALQLKIPLFGQSLGCLWDLKFPEPQAHSSALSPFPCLSVCLSLSVCTIPSLSSTSSVVTAIAAVILTSTVRFSHCHMPEVIRNVLDWNNPLQCN